MKFWSRIAISPLTLVDGGMRKRLPSVCPSHLHFPLRWRWLDWRSRRPYYSTGRFRQFYGFATRSGASVPSVICILCASAIALWASFSGRNKFFRGTTAKLMGLWLLMRFRVASSTSRQGMHHRSTLGMATILDIVQRIWVFCEIREQVSRAWTSQVPWIFHGSHGCSVQRTQSAVDRGVHVPSVSRYISLAVWLRLLSRRFPCLSLLRIPFPRRKAFWRLVMEVTCSARSCTVATFFTAQK